MIGVGIMPVSETKKKTIAKYNLKPTIESSLKLRGGSKNLIKTHANQ